MSAGKGYCRQDFCRHTLSVGKALYRQTVRRYLGVLPSDNPLAILCHGVVMVDGVTWPTTLPPGWTVEWDAASMGEEQEE